MKTVTAREANHNFSKLLAEVERGETVRITKNGVTVAELRPQFGDKRDDPAWQAAYAELLELMRQTPETGFRVGTLTEEEKYGDAPIEGGPYARQ